MYIEPAQPRPRPRPSFPRRAFQRLASSTWSRHWSKPLLVMRWPLTVVVFAPWKFRRRTSIGSIPASTASRSSWISSAKRGCTEPWPRLGPHGGLLVKTRVEWNL